MTINLADFGRNNLMDVPGSLRRLADQMERGEKPMAEHVIVVSETSDGDLKCDGYGKIGDRKSEVGMLFMAALKLAMT